MKMTYGNILRTFLSLKPNGPEDNFSNAAEPD